MIQKIIAPVSVITIYDHKKRFFKPVVLKWDGETYKIKNIGFHHKYRKGKTLLHTFSVSSKSTFFRIVLNTENLSWTLEEISDGLPD